MDELTNPPGGYVKAYGPVLRAEALVVQGLMESSGIPSALVQHKTGVAAANWQPADVLAVWVLADRAEEAAALLSQ